MAQIAPFRGVLYRPAGNHAELLAPPYDVLSPADRARYAALHPKNVVQLILPDGSGDEGYANAARLFAAWQKDGTLVRDAEPALYRYHQTFEAEGESHTRKGVIALLRLERFGEGTVMPHERTLAGPKLDRLKLMRACRAHFSQIFLLYSDPQRTCDRAFEQPEAAAPLVDAQTPDGVRQRLWRVIDAATVKQVGDYLASERVYIADGHHRYETMLTLRDELRAADPEAAADPDSSIHFGCVFLSNLDDPQLVVLPTHRVVHSVAAFDGAALLERAGRQFAIDRRPFAEAPAVRAELAQRGRRGPTVALALPGHAAIVYLTLRPDAASAIPGPEVVRGLDVTVLHTLVLEAILGISRQAQEKQSNLSYIKDTASALAIARSGEGGAQAVFLMNPTRVEQVKAVADAGEVMPQKSTFFVPKLASGLVINVIDPRERVTLER
jgi:uncharacterized protein (DUF1015 family)